MTEPQHSEEVPRPRCHRREPKQIEVHPRLKPVLHRIKPRFDQLLEEWQGRTTAKQRLTPIESGLDQGLVQEDYQVGVTLVRDYLREVKRRKAEVFKLAVSESPRAASRSRHSRSPASEAVAARRISRRTLRSNSSFKGVSELSPFG